VVVYPFVSFSSLDCSLKTPYLVAVTYDWSVEVRDSRVIQRAVQKITASRLQ
jgi:hypothetical protein